MRRGTRALTGPVVAAGLVAAACGGSGSPSSGDRASDADPAVQDLANLDVRGVGVAS